MENGLISVDQNCIALFDSEASVGKLLKPLSKEVFLYNTYIAGISEKDIEGLGDSEKLVLRREDSTFDDCAIAVMKEDGHRLGYVPERDNAVFARLMDVGKILTARVKSIGKKGDLPDIRISIFLVDF